MAPKSGLGKGLGALIPGSTESSPATSGVKQVSVEHIVANPRQPRTIFDPAELEELANSIREHGIIQPLIVSPGADSHFILIAGERRLQAARQAGLQAVPVIERETNDQQRLELALIENVQRADLNPLEEAEAYHQLATDFGLSHELIAARVGKSRVAVTNTMRLINLANAGKEALVKGLISEGHARALLSLAAPEAQKAALLTIIGQQLNVRQTEALVKKMGGEKPAARPKIEPSADVRDIESRLESSLGTKVSLRHGKKGGTLTLHYYSNEELDSLLDLLLNE